MSVLEKIQTALGAAGITAGEGKYPEADEPCAKIVLTGDGKPVHFMGDGSYQTQTFKVIVRGEDYRALESKSDLVKTALKKAGYIAIGCYEDVEPPAGATYMQLAVNFKIINFN